MIAMTNEEFDEYVYRSTCILDAHQKEFGDPVNFRCEKCGGNCSGLMCNSIEWVNPHTRILNPES